MLRCPVCNDRMKDTVITRCFHVFCNPCIKKNLALRHRKCPGCAQPFGEKDVQSIYLGYEQEEDGKEWTRTKKERKEEKLTEEYKKSNEWKQFQEIFQLFSFEARGVMEEVEGPREYLTVVLPTEVQLYIFSFIRSLPDLLRLSASSKCTLIIYNIIILV